MKRLVEVPLRERGKGFFSNLVRIWQSTSITFPDIAHQIIDTINALEYTEFVGVIVTIEQSETEFGIRIEYFYKQESVAKKYEGKYSYPIIMQIPNYLSAELESSRKVQISLEEMDIREMEEDMKLPIHSRITLENLLKLLNGKFYANIDEISLQDMIFYTKVIVKTDNNHIWNGVYTRIDNLPAKCVESLINNRFFTIKL